MRALMRGGLERTGFRLGLYYLAAVCEAEKPAGVEAKKCQNEQRDQFQICLPEPHLRTAVIKPLIGDRNQQISTLPKG
jgi:hypothetical protein